VWPDLIASCNGVNPASAVNMMSLRKHAIKYAHYLSRHGQQHRSLHPKEQ
jgi:hypothetical protein